SEELYDIQFDPNENVNLLIDKFYDRNRFKYYNLEEIYYYPFWDNIPDIYLELKNEKDRIWKEGNLIEVVSNKIDYYGKRGIRNIRKLFTIKKHVKGRFNSTAKKMFYDK
ncbi:hypothetical protein K8R66_01390, partial [bacterium]|nr:hypothetical protein [bacterium]